ncbi:hypothetical protein APS56_12285 [Pseudalgibacter alginicilyticus]|uniref:Uncharacterized protein n=1 Tax=Pseudalgibacter alginicilyticus TaxID=1736674 RepID=A0A0P0CZ15_9FLAO|nr:hypothetical protein APS56_12285 [Pseudalgibacter alginicilyticus]
MNAQEVNVNGKVYTVKKEAIFKDGADITETLTIEEKDNIKDKLENKIRLEKEEKERAAQNKKAEKEQKKAESKQKATEKALNKKVKAQANFEKADKKYDDAVKKYEKLKGKGKLSPNDESKWLNKIEKLKKSSDKAKSKL